MTNARSVGRVLIVDDVPANRELLESLLQRDGYELDAVDRGEAALASVAEHPPDVVLLDVMLPGLDGFEVCRRLKSDPATRLIPVVLVTSLHEREDKIQGIEAGADDFLTKPVNAHELRARVRSLIRLKQYTDELDSADDVIISLALTVEARDQYTDAHCHRLASYATALGVHLDLPDHDLGALHRGGYLHDIGKVGIPDALLGKPGALSAEEVAVMQTHTVVGDRLCGRLRALAKVRPIVRHHHERLDGSGYPDGLQGDEIPLLAQIVGVVDVFDALTTDRPYRRAMTPDAALAVLRDEVNRGWRRADLVEIVADLWDSGSLERLRHVQPSAPVPLSALTVGR